jgi:hypothetical protein
MASKNQVRLEAVAEVQKARSEILKLVETVNKLTEALGKTADKKFQITTGESIAKLDALEKELADVGKAVTKSADAVEKESKKSASSIEKAQERASKAIEKARAQRSAVDRRRQEGIGFGARLGRQGTRVGGSQGPAVDCGDHEEGSCAGPREEPSGAPHRAEDRRRQKGGRVGGRRRGARRCRGEKEGRGISPVPGGVEPPHGAAPQVLRGPGQVLDLRPERGPQHSGFLRFHHHREAQRTPHRDHRDRRRLRAVQQPALRGDWEQRRSRRDVPEPPWLRRYFRPVSGAARRAVPPLRHRCEGLRAGARRGPHRLRRLRHREPRRRQLDRADAAGLRRPGADFQQGRRPGRGTQTAVGRLSPGRLQRDGEGHRRHDEGTRRPPEGEQGPRERGPAGARRRASEDAWPRRAEERHVRPRRDRADEERDLSRKGRDRSPRRSRRRSTSASKPRARRSRSESRSRRSSSPRSRATRRRRPSRPRSSFSPSRPSSSTARSRSRRARRSRRRSRRSSTSTPSTARRRRPRSRSSPTSTTS